MLEVQLKFKGERRKRVVRSRQGVRDSSEQAIVHIG